MDKPIEQQLEEITLILNAYPEGLYRGEISKKLSFSINHKTLQRRLSVLHKNKKIRKEGEKRAAKYFPLTLDIATETNEALPLKRNFSDKIFSKTSIETLRFLDEPVHQRKQVAYNREFLEAYTPNKSIYIPLKQREKLATQGKRFDEQLAAGTYAQQISQRLLIDLSYNSSRLEGNTYSKLDTQKLLVDGKAAEGKANEETVMIMNHKEAISFLIHSAQAIELKPITIRNLHNLLSQDLLPNPKDCGNVRATGVDIGKSVYTPLNNPHLLKELLELILLKARKIENAFEQSFFLLIHLSYLQTFIDVNKRTARLSCNIPFIKENLCPLSFIDVSRDDYSAALLAIYEINHINPMLDLFCWAYVRSCNQYAVVKESLGEIDISRLQYRTQRKQIMGKIVRENLHGKEAEKCIEAYCLDNDMAQADKFLAATLTELETLHAGAIIGLGITEKQLTAWLDSK